ncbi:MAG: hypothetical protein HGA44_04910 [Cellulomonadaceae bacterium]|nr:hypothetical protein [Cellulomonadaceae bacterium]
MPEQLAFVSVVFEAELWFQRLQARSMALYLSPDLVGEIVVIDNSVDGLDPGWVAALVKDYGPHAPLVRVLRPDDIVAIPAATGWRSQQVLKLCVAEQLSTRHYVVLDAKNHLVLPVDGDFFVAADGRPRVNTYGFADHPLRSSLERALTYVGLDPAGYVGRFTATVTPFVLDTAMVRSMIRAVEERAGRPFAAEFVAQGLTEFFLYTAWLLAQGSTIDELVDDHQVFCPTVWPRAANPDGVRAAIASVHDRRAPFFSVQRNALAALDRAGIELLAALWVERGLFASTEQVLREVEEFQVEYARQSRRQRVRELPHRLRGAVRRLGRSVPRPGGGRRS